MTGVNGTFWSSIKLTVWEILEAQRQRSTTLKPDPVMHKRVRATLSGALDDFLSTGRWRRDLTDEEHACLCQRLECAWRFVIAMQTLYRPMLSPAKPKTIVLDPHRDVTAEDVLKWLLIDVWNTIKDETLSERSSEI